LEAKDSRAIGGPVLGEVWRFHSHRGFSPVMIIAADLSSRFNGFLKLRKENR